MGIALYLVAFLVFCLVVKAGVNRCSYRVRGFFLSEADLFVCDLDGADSALYERRIRTCDWDGLVWKVVEYRRVSCTPGKSYSSEVSGWFKPTYDGKAKRDYDTYKRLSPTAAAEKIRQHFSVAPKIVWN